MNNATQLINFTILATNNRGNAATQRNMTIGRGRVN